MWKQRKVLLYGWHQAEHVLLCDLCRLRGCFLKFHSINQADVINFTDFTSANFGTLTSNGIQAARLKEAGYDSVRWGLSHASQNGVVGAVFVSDPGCRFATSSISLTFRPSPELTSTTWAGFSHEMVSNGESENWVHPYIQRLYHDKFDGQNDGEGEPVVPTTM